MDDEFEMDDELYVVIATNKISGRQEVYGPFYEELAAHDWSAYVNGMGGKVVMLEAPD